VVVVLLRSRFNLDDAPWSQDNVNLRSLEEKGLRTDEKMDASLVMHRRNHLSETKASFLGDVRPMVLI
jgi:hypothetical protein